MRTFNLTHIDTCLGCYLTDHHNRPGEALFGIATRNQTSAEAAVELGEEIAADERVPFSLDGEACASACIDVCSDVDWSCDDADNSEDAVQAWFLLTWEDE